jgi:hypothetical protein
VLSALPILSLQDTGLGVQEIEFIEGIQVAGGAGCG